MISEKISESVVPAVEKSVTVGLPVEEAFRLFTSKIHTWWPLATHSIGEENAESCVMEEKEGGRFYEILKDGSQKEWGTVLVWEPPRRFITSWHPGRESSTAQELEVIFTAEGQGTRLDLSHRNWELLGADAEETRNNYVRGWKYVLGLYIEEAGA
jgi:uncharacterized protein YndB with AHSA1/START domain